MKASDIFVQALVAEGIKYIFGVPGEENLDLLESLRTSPITFIPTRHEQAAGFMAATIGRLTGTPGVSLSTLGPGATNLVTAVAYAELGAMPALFITGQKPIKNSKQGQFQIIDTVGMMKPLTKYTKQIVSARLVAPTVQEALKLAKEERPGAVHLELPEDVAAETLDNPIRLTHTPLTRRPIAEDKAIATAVAMLHQAKHPLIMVGSGANRKRVTKMLTQLIDKTHIPFCTTQMGKGVIDERRQEYLGTAALSDHDHLHHQIHAADVILNIGHDTIEKPPFLLKNGHEQKIIHLNFLPANIDLIYQPEHEVVGDIANAIWQISEKLQPAQHWDFSVFRSVQVEIEKPLTKDGTSPLAIVKAVRSSLESEDIVTLDNGMYKIWFARHFETQAPNTLLLDNALATMGAGLPSAIAAKLINPHKKVVSIVGDGGFMMNSQELETAKRLNLDLAIVLLRDDAYGMISWKQQAAGYTDFGLRFNNPDFLKYAEAYGVIGHRINSAKELAKTLKKTFSEGGIHLIDMPIDYSDNRHLGA